MPIWKITANCIGFCGNTLEAKNCGSDRYPHLLNLKFRRVLLFSGQIYNVLWVYSLRTKNKENLFLRTDPVKRFFHTLPMSGEETSNCIIYFVNNQNIGPTFMLSQRRSFVYFLLRNFPNNQLRKCVYLHNNFCLSK